MISSQDLSALKERADLRTIAAMYGALEKKGKDMWGLCPFHTDTNPSFTVYAAGFNCFSCGAKGDVFRFIQDIEKIGFQDAVNRVAELCGEDAPKHAPGAPDAPSAPARPKSPRGPCVAKYLYHDAAGKLAYEIRRYEPGEMGRKKDFQPYMPGANRAGLGGTQRYLYNLPAVLAASEVWIVEGEKDADTLSNLGITATTPAGGANAKWEPSFTTALKGRNLVIVPDNDEPGRKYAERIGAHLGFPPVLQLPDAYKDVTNFTESGGTLEQLRALIPEEASAAPVSTVSTEERDPLGDLGWRDVLSKSNNGVAKVCVRNAMVALQYAPEWSGVLRFDTLSSRTIAVKPTPWKYTGTWTDTQDSKLAYWLQEEEVMVNTAIAAEAVEAVAHESEFSPLREYLNGLVWDRTPRCHRWISTYLGVDPKSYGGNVGEIGAMWLIQAVARAYRPAVQADTCLILEGPQGKYKSSALRILGGDWFSDDIAELGSKDSKMQLAGKWIVEIAELDSMSRGEISKVKAFITCRSDYFRPSYGRRAMDYPRQCVFAGSTNDNEYLRDPSGARRFWPVKCGTIDPDALRRDRDQLWSEAVERFKAGKPWWITDAVALAAAEVEQADRHEGDAWQSIVSGYLSARSDTSTTEIMMECIQKPLGQWTKSDEMRIGRILTSGGWERYRRSVGAKREWRYRGPEE